MAMGPKRGHKKSNFDKYYNNYFSLTSGQNALIFDIEYPWGKWGKEI